MTKAFNWAANGFTLPKECDTIKTHGNIKRPTLKIFYILYILYLYAIIYISNNVSGPVSQYVRSRLKGLRVKYEEEDRKHEAADSSLYLEYSAEQIDLIDSIRDGTTQLEDICLACVSKANSLQKHPLFHGSLCDPCMVCNIYKAKLTLLFFLLQF